MAGVVVVAALAAGAFFLLSGDDDGGDSRTGGGRDGGGEGAGGQVGGAAGSDDPSTLTGTWEGTFECGGEESALALTIDDPGDGTLGANFAVPEEGETPTDETWRYSMEGTSGDQLVLEGSEWIVPEEPGADAVMYGLEADLAGRQDPEHLEGTVTGGDCTGFSVDRASTDPWYAGVWEGQYGCNQGLTSLRMTIEGESSDTVEAVYEFFAHPENPGVPSGSYRMEGTYDSARELSLRGVEWIDQPQGYIMVDLLFIADLGVDPQRLYGTISETGEGCSVFTLSRAEDGGGNGGEDGGGNGSENGGGAGGGRDAG